MPIVKSNSAPNVAVDPRIANTLWQWLTLGALAVALLPAARGDSWWLGSLPFWLIAVPASALLMLYRHTLAAAWRRRRLGIRSGAPTIRVANREPQAHRFRSPRLPARPLTKGAFLHGDRRRSTAQRTLATGSRA